MLSTVKLPVRVYFYFLCQALNITAVVMSVTMSAILGNKLAEAGGFSPALATLPYGLQFFAVMVVTYPASMLMKRIGRKKSFLIATGFLAGAGILGYWAAAEKLFIVLSLAHLALGCYVAFANYFRFAVTDGLEPSLKAKAMSLVVSGGVVAALLGPNFANFFRDFGGQEEFAAAYGLYVILSLSVFVLVFVTPPPPASVLTSASPAPENKMVSNAHRGQIIFLAIFAGAASYGLMNLLMTQSSLMMHKSHIHFQDVAFAIEMHVLSMFVPSFFTGSLIARFGNRKILLTGFALLVVSALLNIWSQTYHATVIGLMFLGIGWNFGYIGGGSLLSQSTSEEGAIQGAIRLQGINDTVVGIVTFTTAFTSSVFFHYLGWVGTNTVSLVTAALGLGLVYFIRPNTL